MKTEFHYNRIESCWNPAWWSGEPVRTFINLVSSATSHSVLQMWETAGKAGLITANLMWLVDP